MSAAAFDDLADAYDLGRTGYSSELYDTIAEFGLRVGSRVLDLACGTGLAAGPLIDRGFSVTGVDASEPMLGKARARYPATAWVCADALDLPFDPGSFEGAICAQAMHHLDASRALSELTRVVASGGTLAIWWKVLATQDPVRNLREQVARDLGVAPLETPLRGFRAFYAAALQGQQVRVLPWQTVLPLSAYLAYERSRALVRERCGPRTDEYVARLDSRLREHVGGGDPRIPLNYVQFLYLAKVP